MVSFLLEHPWPARIVRHNGHLLLDHTSDFFFQCLHLLIPIGQRNGSPLRRPLGGLRIGWDRWIGSHLSFLQLSSCQTSEFSATKSQCQSAQEPNGPKNEMQVKIAGARTRSAQVTNHGPEKHYTSEEVEDRLSQMQAYCGTHSLVSFIHLFVCPTPKARRAVKRRLHLPVRLLGCSGLPTQKPGDAPQYCGPGRFPVPRSTGRLSRAREAEYTNSCRSRHR